MNWAQLAQSQAGVISRGQLIALGWPERGVARALSSGALTPTVTGVFLVRGAPFTYDAQLWTAIVSTGGVLGFATAAALWGMDERPPLVHVIVGTERRVARRQTLRRHHVFTPRTAVTTIDGMPVTTRAWTLLDHVGRLRYPDALRLVDRAVQRGWLRESDLAGRLRDYPGRQGNSMIRRLLSATGHGAAAESERRLHRILRAAGLNRWRANYRVVSAGLIVAVVDVAFVAERRDRGGRIRLPLRRRPVSTRPTAPKRTRRPGMDGASVHLARLAEPS